jgi:hypothetical protein
LAEKLIPETGFIEPGMFWPVIIGIALREPCDDFHGAMQKLEQNPWYQNALKAAVTIGADSSNTARRFVGSENGVIVAKSYKALEDAIPFLTLEAIKLSLDMDMLPEYDKHDVLVERIKDQRMQNNPDPVYGDGYRMIRDIARRSGDNGVIMYLRNRHK